MFAVRSNITTHASNSRDCCDHCSGLAPHIRFKPKDFLGARSYPSPPMSRPETPQHGTIDIRAETATIPVSTQPFVLSNPNITSRPSIQPNAFSSTVSAHTSTPAIGSGSYTTSSRSQAALPQDVISTSTNFTASASAPTLLIPIVGPSRQIRRGKKHVAFACINCKRAHLGCDVERPCRRCIDTGKEDSCYDVQHKKRGRPRLREEREVDTAPTSPQQTIGPQQHAASRLIANPRPRRANSYQSHQSKGGESSSHGQRTPMNHSMPGVPLMQPLITKPSEAAPMCILNLDLYVLRVNKLFEDIFGTSESIIGHHVEDLVSPVQQSETFVSIRNHIRRERDKREPTYLPPILEQGNDPLHAFQGVELLRHLQSDPTSEHDWMPRRARGGVASIHVKLWLVKTSFYFVVVTISTLSQSWQTLQPLTQHQSAAPSTPASGPSFLSQDLQTDTRQPPGELYQMPYSSGISHVEASLQPPEVPYSLDRPQSLMKSQDTSRTYNDTTAAGLWYSPAPPSTVSGNVPPPYANIPPTSFMPQLGPAFPVSLAPRQSFQSSSLEPGLDTAPPQDEDRSGSEARPTKRRRRIDIDDVVERR